MSTDWLRYTQEGGGWFAPQPLPGPIETARTVVRRYETGDGPALFAAVDESREGILPWMLWASTDHRRAEHSIYYVERFRRAAVEPGCTDYPMGIFDRVSGELIGATGLHQLSRSSCAAELGWWVHPARWGQGLCSEAIAGLISAALRPQDDGGWGLRRLYATVATDNPGSRRVCEKLGLRLEARMREDRYLGYPEHAPRGWIDVLGYAVLAREWNESEGRAHPEPWPE